MLFVVSNVVVVVVVIAWLLFSSAPLVPGWTLGYLVRVRVVAMVSALAMVLVVCPFEFVGDAGKALD